VTEDIQRTPAKSGNDISEARAIAGCLFFAIFMVILLGGAVFGIWWLVKNFVTQGHYKTRTETVVHIAPAGSEEAAVDALIRLAVAQAEYKKWNGSYVAVPALLAGMPGLDQNITSSSSPQSTYHGYYFIGIQEQGRGKVDLKTGYVFAAVPADYGGNSIQTFVIGPNGKILGKDIGDAPPQNANEIDSTWEVVKTVGK